MRIHALPCAAMLVALSASAQEVARGIDLIPGHPIHHESEKEAGVAMALSITPDPKHTGTDLCEELRVAAGLGNEQGDDLRLETIFVVPYKGMAVEGYYLPRDGSFASYALVRGKDIARSTLDGVVSRAGIPPRVLDETRVEQEVSCSPHDPVWSIAWSDVRPIGEEQPEAVIERAQQRFLEIHRSVVEYEAADVNLQQAQRGARDG